MPHGQIDALWRRPSGRLHWWRRRRRSKSIRLPRATTEQAASGVGRESHATSGQEASATNSMTHIGRDEDYPLGCL